MTHRFRRLRFPIWKYLNQPVLDKTSPLILRPSAYWQTYQRQHLDRCWQVSYPSERESRNP